MSTKCFLRTGDMAAHLGRSVRWLKGRKDVTFVKGVHYHQPDGEREPFWDVGAMEAWVRSEVRDDRVESILQKVS
jgi:hypothetical protein